MPLYDVSFAAGEKLSVNAPDEAGARKHAEKATEIEINEGGVKRTIPSRGAVLKVEEADKLAQRNAALKAARGE